jgi:hypothetical protein
VIPAIDLHNEPHLGRKKVRDEPPEQRHLPAKADPRAARRAPPRTAWLPTA